jgi:hypothetical protein
MDTPEILATLGTRLPDLTVHMSNMTVHMSNLTVHMSNMAGVLKEGSSYPSRAPEFTPVFGRVRVFLRPVFCVPNVASISGVSILDCHFGFL